MGVLNVTPDSFSDGGRFLVKDIALRHVERMVDEGAAIIDVGGESTRPGAEAISAEEELERVIPLIEAVHSRFPVLISVDTTKPQTMREAVGAGAGMINDVSALRTAGALEAARDLGVPVCLMHMQGEPRTMQVSPHYDDVVTEVRDFLMERVSACEKAGIVQRNILVDPGFGFGKTLQHNLRLLARLEVFIDMGFPVLVGMSRKSMIGTMLDKPVDQRLHGSVAAAVIAASKGAAIVRVHDVAATVDALKVVEAVRETAQT